MKIVMVYNLCNGEDQFLYCEIGKTIINQFRKLKNRYNNFDLIEYLNNEVEDADFYGISTMDGQLDWSPSILQNDKIISHKVLLSAPNNYVFESYYGMGVDLLKLQLKLEKQFSSFLWSNVVYERFIMPKDIFRQYVEFLNNRLGMIQNNEFKIIVYQLLTSYFMWKNENLIKVVPIYIVDKQKNCYFKR